MRIFSVIAVDNRNYTHKITQNLEIALQLQKIFKIFLKNCLLTKPLRFQIENKESIQIFQYETLFET